MLLEDEQIIKRFSIIERLSQKLLKRQFMEEILKTLDLS
jgi:hypothetical protein